MQNLKNRKNSKAEILKSIENQETTEVLRCLWPFLLFSRCLGLFPIARQGNRLVTFGTTCRLFWIPTILGLSYHTLVVMKNIKQGILHVLDGSVGSLVRDMNDLILFAQNVAFYIFMIYKIKDIPALLEDFAKVEIMCKKFQKSIRGGRLVRDTWLLLAFLFSTQLFFGSLLYYSLAIRGNVTTFNEFVSQYNTDFFGSWSLNYTGPIYCFGGLYFGLSWNFGDTLISLLALILTRYFIRINRVLADAPGMIYLEKVEHLRCVRQEICCLVQHCNDLFSVLFLLTYAGNLTHLLTRLYLSFQDDLSEAGIFVRIESLNSFFNQIFIKILLPSYLAARLNEEAHEALNLVQDWPSGLEEPDCRHRLLTIERFISHLEIPVGFSGCGYFIINKSFIVTLVSALITYEVIILQFQTAANAKLAKAF